MKLPKKFQSQSTFLNKMPNPLHAITHVFKDHFTTEDKDIYINTINLLDHCATELDKFEYETDGEGEQILQDLNEAVDEYNKSQREEEEVETDDDDIKDLDREDDNDEDEPTTEGKVT